MEYVAFHIKKKKKGLFANGLCAETEIAAAQFQVPESQGCRASGAQDALPVYSADAALGAPGLADGCTDALPTPSAWPPELVDSMVWSSQFLGAVQPKDQV